MWHPLKLAALFALPLVALGAAGCKKPAAGPPVKAAPAPPAPGFAPGLAAAAADDPELKAAQAAAAETLDGLLAGRYDNDPSLSPVARKVKGYTSWSITAQEKQDRGTGSPIAWDFTGTLAAPGRSAGFTASLAKQRDGSWAIGSFKGPDPN